jgi:hypothetical protein
MTTTVQTDCHISSSMQRWIMLAILPVILAAGAIEKSSSTIEIPDEEAYRTPLSDALFESLRWRAPQEEEHNWRIPPPPPVDWRANPESRSKSSSSDRSFEIFPRYQPGRPSDFDLREHEEKPLIKLFEFGTK